MAAPPAQVQPIEGTYLAANTAACPASRNNRNSEQRGTSTYKLGPRSSNGLAKSTRLTNARR
jgi:hypothetical protein